jgi:hypothetical protein
MRLKFLAFAIFLAAFPISANANVLIEIERLSDTQAIITGSGSIDVGTPQIDNPQILTLSDPFGSEPSLFQNLSVLSATTLSLGSVSFDFAHDCGPGFACAGPGITAIYFGSFSTASVVTGDTFSGSLTISLQAGTTLAAVGSTGTVYWGDQLDPVTVAHG